MKRLTSVLLAIALITSFASAGYAQNPPAKLTRGLVNTFTGIWELPINVLKMCKSEGAPKGLTIGVVQGVAWGVYRTLVGLYEVVTFPIPAPAGYAAITDPATLLTSETLETGDPSLRGDFRPLSSEYEGKTRRK